MSHKDDLLKTSCASFIPRFELPCITLTHVTSSLQTPSACDEVTGDYR